MAWDRALLPPLLQLVRAVEPKVEVQWDNRLAVAFRVPGVKRAWATFWTKNPDGLDCRCLGKKGQFNLSQVEKFGLRHELAPHKEGELLRIVFQHENHLHAPQLKELLRQHLQGFRETFA